MTHDLLETDIALARSLIAEGRPDVDLIVALSRRGVSSVKAQQLVEDLRAGREVKAAELPLGIALRSPPPQPAPTSTASGRRRSHRAPGRLKPVGLTVLVLAILACWWFMFRSPARSARAGISAASATPGLVLKLGSGGLELNGTPVTRQNALGELCRVLGAPSRTNSSEDKLSYAFDQHGLVLFALKDRDNDSLVLDCDAVGGIAGTTSQFAGKLELRDESLRPETAASALSAMKSVGIKHQGEAEGIYTANFDNFELYFAYLKSPKRLSLIQINLR